MDLLSFAGVIPMRVPYMYLLPLVSCRSYNYFQMFVSLGTFPLIQRVKFFKSFKTRLKLLMNGYIFFLVHTLWHCTSHNLTVNSF
ncbi:hypothetical protein MPTK1_1g17570 [Marchantia polymorpha subsp. ruderalis]|uniref:Uncharacterized protein n=2 Tax=Marchantia polymorpha TaxID=3197 RepID=A0AAF6AR92_MARPO|nr:hypothetical protein MARPO_0001s0097 [Marchantia polymorpha]BBM98962.1 hypothetical protein Mp_1g17570 [Marchantia polymorpha subsp. ruderalis]|eukprot:PTQ50039.1 hypothetical protein MARPO_0001s0097 [Marchantia polymorpha]